MMIRYIIISCYIIIGLLVSIIFHYMLYKVDNSYTDIDDYIDSEVTFLGFVSVAICWPIVIIAPILEIVESIFSTIIKTIFKLLIKIFGGNKK